MSHRWFKSICCNSVSGVTTCPFKRHHTWPCLTVMSGAFEAAPP